MCLWRQMKSIPPIAKAGKFVHGANTPRSHLDPHHPSPIPSFEGCGCVGSSRGRTSHLPAAIFDYRSIVITWFSKKPGRTMYLGQQLPNRWAQNDTNPSSMVLRRDLYVYSVGWCCFSGCVEGYTKRLSGWMGCHHVRWYVSQRPGGVRSSPAQLWEGEIKGYTIELPVRLENALFNTTKLFYVLSIEKVTWSLTPCMSDMDHCLDSC